MILKYNHFRRSRITRERPTTGRTVGPYLLQNCVVAFKNCSDDHFLSRSDISGFFLFSVSPVCSFSTTPTVLFSFFPFLDFSLFTLGTWSESTSVLYQIFSKLSLSSFFLRKMKLAYQSCQDARIDGPTRQASFGMLKCIH